MREYSTILLKGVREIEMTATKLIIFRKGGHGYEEARRDSVWCASVWDRYPAVIVKVRNEKEAIEAIKLARKENLKVTVRSGGHSWPGNHLRDDVMMIDVNALKDVSVDPATMTATAQPGLTGSELNSILSTYEFFFPVGHCPTVCIGGYLLQGGYAWNGRKYGPACMSIIGLDAITADGELIHVDENENADLLWAARGAGPGFFALVTRFYIKVYPRYAVAMRNLYEFPIDTHDELFRWAHKIGVQTELELIGMIFRDEKKDIKRPIISFLAVAFSDSEVNARKLLKEVEGCPVRHRALTTEEYSRQSLTNLSASAYLHYLPEKRYVADNVWYHDFEKILPEMTPLLENFPPAPSHTQWTNWGYVKSPKRLDMAFSLEDDFYIALYGAWSDPMEDDKYITFVTKNMRALAPHSTGIQLADENLINRPARFMSDENMRKLAEIRAKWDKDLVFPEWFKK
jgi:hypothetical protein